VDLEKSRRGVLLGSGLHSKLITRCHHRAACRRMVRQTRPSRPQTAVFRRILKVALRGPGQVASMCAAKRRRRFQLRDVLPRDTGWQWRQADVRLSFGYRCIPHVTDESPTHAGQRRFSFCLSIEAHRSGEETTILLFCSRRVIVYQLQRRRQIHSTLKPVLTHSMVL
jgi:hypothetical protein